MSLAPYLCNSALQAAMHDLSRLTPSIFDQNFGLGVLHDDLVHPPLMPVPLFSGYLRPWRHQSTRNSGVSNIQNNQDVFKVNLDVQQFKPEEVNVKVVDNYIIVEGKHEEREDEHGYISRQFQRRYRIPEDVNVDALVSKLSSDGVLSIEAPKKALPPPTKERKIEIALTNAPAVTAKPAATKDAPEKMDQ
ncbi:hypothetical protein R5R35_004253 [Gryllus longicercus]|uniref:SHSP domain-containing protein n=1 Tax=Gryllus longicercus TaxID=2509291 RepID=A0AAN9WLJ4_9ORTH